MQILTTADLPSDFTATIIPPPPAHEPVNVLILLHGLGDSYEPFTSFARAVALPETLGVSVCAPKRVPLTELAFHWGDDLSVDSSTGEIEANGPSFTESQKLVGTDLIKDTLLSKVGYKSRDVLIFGFGQGASVGFAVALDSGDELGGVVSIGGCLPVDIATPLKTKNRTPILLCKGERLSGVSDNEIERIKAAFEFVEVIEWHKTGDGMPTNREEMLPIMKFFARRLRSMKGVPKGSIEIR